MRHGNTSESPSWLTARAAILFMRAVLPDTVNLVPGYTIVLPSTLGMTDNQAATALATLEKPLACAAEAHHGVLAIRCRQLSAAEEEDHRQVIDSDPEEPFGPEELNALHRSRRCLVLLVGRGEHMLVPAICLRDLFRNFLFEMTYEYSFRPPTRLERWRRAALVFEPRHAQVRVEVLTEDEAVRRGVTTFEALRASIQDIDAGGMETSEQ